MLHFDERVGHGGWVIGPKLEGTLNHFVFPKYHLSSKVSHNSCVYICRLGPKFLYALLDLNYENNLKHCDTNDINM